MTKTERKIIADECGKAWLNMAICLQNYRDYYNNFEEQSIFQETNEYYIRLQNQWYSLQLLCDKLKIEMSDEYSDEAFEIILSINRSFEN